MHRITDIALSYWHRSYQPLPFEVHFQALADYLKEQGVEVPFELELQSGNRR